MNVRLLHRRPEPVKDSFADALRLAAEVLARTSDQTANDPAGVAAPDRAPESVEVSQ